MTLASLWSGHPQVTELVIAHPVLHVPLLRERIGPLDSAVAPAAAGSEPDANAPIIDRVTVTDGAMEFSNLRDRVNNRIDGINAQGHDAAAIARSRLPAARKPASTRSNSTSAPPRPPIRGERQNIPVELKLEAPGALQAPLSAKAEVRLNGSVVMINGLSGTLGDGAFNGWASADLASKPLVKLDLDFQRLDVAVTAEEHRIVGSARPAARLEQRHDRSDRVELCRRASAHLRRRDQHRRRRTSRRPRSTERWPAAC